jgi:hypothetical protein
LVTVPSTGARTSVRSRFSAARSRAECACASAARSFDARRALLRRLLGHHVGHRAIAAVFADRLVEFGLLAREVRIGLFERDPVAGRIDHQQHLALRHFLVVVHPHVGDEAAHVGRDRHHVGAHLAVARERLDLVTHP